MMANRKVASELNELLKKSGGGTGIRTLGAYRKSRDSTDLDDNLSKLETESQCDDGDSKGEKGDDLGEKSSVECSRERSEASYSKAKAASSGYKAECESADSSSGGDDCDDATGDTGKSVTEKGCSDRAKTDTQDSEGAIEGNNTQQGYTSQNKTKVRTRPVIGPDLLPKPDRSKISEIQSKQSESAFVKRSSFHESYTRREVSDFNSNIKVKEAENADVNSNVKKVPMIGRMGFSLDLNKELNAKFAAAKLQMTGTRKQVPTTTTPTEGKKQPPVPLPRPRKPDEVTRDRLANPKEQREEKIEGSSKFVDLDTGHIYEDIDLYQSPEKCEVCKKETVESEEQSKDVEGGKKDEKKKKKPRFSMLCMCRQTSNDPPSAGLSEKTDSKTCLLAGETQTSSLTSESNKNDSGGYEKLQRQKPSFRGGYEVLRNSLAEEEENKSPEGAVSGSAVVRKREFKNESTKKLNCNLQRIKVFQLSVS